jgi:signal transduction histidine kinase
MKEGELYMIQLGISEQHIDNMYNDGMITQREREQMKIPFPGVFVNYSSDEMTKETIDIMTAKVEELNKTIEKNKRNLDSMLVYARDGIIENLNRKADLKAYGNFLTHDSGILRCIKMSDASFTKVDD